MNPQIVLTKFDLLQERIIKTLGKDATPKMIQDKMQEEIDLKKENIVSIMDVPNSSIYFIENYHTDSIVIK